MHQQVVSPCITYFRRAAWIFIKKKKLFCCSQCCHLHFLFTAAVGDDKWELSRTRRLSGSSAPDYCVIEGSGQAIIVASEKPFEFVYDSLHPVQTAEATNGTNGLSVPGMVYSQFLQGTCVL